MANAALSEAICACVRAGSCASVPDNAHTASHHAATAVCSLEQDSVHLVVWRMRLFGKGGLRNSTDLTEER